MLYKVKLVLHHPHFLPWIATLPLVARNDRKVRFYACGSFDNFDDFGSYRNVGCPRNDSTCRRTCNNVRKHRRSTKAVIATADI